MGAAPSTCGDDLDQVNFCFGSDIALCVLLFIHFIPNMINIWLETSTYIQWGMVIGPSIALAIAAAIICWTCVAKGYIKHSYGTQTLVLGIYSLIVAGLGLLLGCINSNDATKDTMLFLSGMSCAIIIYNTTNIVVRRDIQYCPIKTQ